MPKGLHDVKFSIDLVIKYSILQESSLLAFFDSKHFAVLYCSEFKYRRKCSTSNATDNIVFVSASPVASIMIGIGTRSEAYYGLFR